jgi:hypothetical protein
MFARALGLIDYDFIVTRWRTSLDDSQVIHAREFRPVNTLDLIKPKAPTRVNVADNGRRGSTSSICCNRSTYFVLSSPTTHKAH